MLPNIYEKADKGSRYYKKDCQQGKEIIVWITPPPDDYMEAHTAKKEQHTS
jgi:hypothetical protein